MPEAPKTMPCPRCNGTKKFNNKKCAMCKATGGVAGHPRFNTATHVAERAIDINGRVIQRCVWCGFKLIDVLVRLQPIDERGKAAPVFTWAPGDMVRVPIDGEQTRTEIGKPMMVGHMHSDILPPDFCYEAIE